MRSRRSIIVSSTIQQEPPWYGTVCPVVWEDGGSNPASYPIKCHQPLLLFALQGFSHRIGYPDAHPG